MRFIDEAKILVRSGKGGGGCVSFRREKYIPRGGPNGGDGGKGGDVIFRASGQLLTLYDFRLKRVYEAENGRPGLGSQCNGRHGEDLVVDVPVGTLIYEVFEEEQSEKLICDLTENGQEIAIALGGRGGKGNMHFKTATMRAPRFAQPGEPGEEKNLRLELKIIADAGIVGLPNAGKSTLISALSAARPKIASYPFTTLTPNLGVMEGDDGRRLVMADIPGLIEGAHEGLGLGHQFLRHVERNRFLVHLLSVEEIDLDEPFSGFDLVDAEIKAFDEALAAKPQIRVVSKIDLWDADKLAELRRLAALEGKPVFQISALTGEGLPALVEEMWRLSDLEE
ncbi:MAG: GTPase ObgE [Desulfovibrionaceae bacterium]|nr:GTPase ObgE [Desulfovibrionaceae bacterium]MBF0513966.1 GTPase ObgE [Desulfovibrionaceae bacterium]